MLYFYLCISSTLIFAQTDDIPLVEVKETFGFNGNITEIRSGSERILLESDIELVNKNGVYLSRLKLSDEGYIEIKVKNPQKASNLKLKIYASHMGFANSDFKEIIELPIIEEDQWVDIIIKPEIKNNSKIYLKWALETGETSIPQVETELVGLEAHFLTYEIINFSDLKVEKSALEGVVLNTAAKTFHLELEEVNLVTDDFKIVLYDGVEKKIAQNIKLPKTYSGLNVASGGEVRLTIADNFIYGFIEEGGETYYIEPANYFDKSCPKNQVVVYSNSDAANIKEMTCGVKETHDNSRKYHSEDILSTQNCQIVDYPVASDFSMFNHYGSVTNLVNWNLGVINNVQSNYINQLQKNYIFQLKEHFIVTVSGSDPWTSSTNPYSLLPDFGL